MKKDFEAQNAVLAKISSHLKNFEKAFNEVTVDNSEIVDLCGHLDSVIKTATKIRDEKKKVVTFVDNEAKGKFWKLTKKVYAETEIPFEKIQNEICEEDISKVVTVVGKKLSAFIPNARIEELKEKIGEKVKLTFSKV